MELRNKLKTLSVVVKYFRRKEDSWMGTIVCQTCDATIDHFEDEKVTVLYSKCNCCHEEELKQKEC
jgi:hypothetical protein